MAEIDVSQSYEWNKVKCLYLIEGQLRAINRNLEAILEKMRYA